MRCGVVGWLKSALPAVAVILSLGTAGAQPGPASQPEAGAGAASSAANAPAAADKNAAPTSPGAPAPAASPDTFSPLRLMDGPSLRETGRIAVAPAPMPMNGIDSDAAPSTVPKERAASTIDATPAARPTGFIDSRVLDREIAEHFQDIAGCRVEVARAKQLMPSQIVADKLLLRWIIAPDGSTVSTDVVAIMPVDLGIMDCAKRVMSQWTFTRPRGGPMTVERRFAFN